MTRLRNGVSTGMSTLALFMSMHLAGTAAKALAPSDPLAEFAPLQHAERQTEHFRYPTPTADDFVQFGDVAAPALIDDYADDFALLGYLDALRAPPVFSTPTPVVRYGAAPYGAWQDEFVLPPSLPSIYA